MRKLVFLILALAMAFSACTKDYINDEVNVTLKKSVVSKGVERPMFVWFSARPDMTLPPVICMPSEYGAVLGGGCWISGHATHIGKVDEANSHFTVSTCYFNQYGQLIELGGGTITGANGDAFYFTVDMLINPADFTFTGTITMDGGTGRFVNAYGTEIIAGGVDLSTGIVSWTGEGIIVY
jgi:hypothetical protein